MVSLFECGSGDIYPTREFDSLHDALEASNKQNLTWINIDSMDDKTLDEIASLPSVHRLTNSYLKNPNPRSRFDEFDGYSHMVVTAAGITDVNAVFSQDLHLLIWPSLIISVSDSPHNFFMETIDQLGMGHTRLQGRGVDFLLYLMLAEIAENFDDIIARVHDKVEEMDADLVEGRGKHETRGVHEIKSAVMKLRRLVTPMRDTVALAADIMARKGSDDVAPYMRDLSTHVASLVDETDVYLDMLSSLSELYVSEINNRMSESMRVLTVISSIFIPMTFIAGLYGMNFQHMPELGWRWGYPGVMLAMGTIAIGMMWYFKRNKWL